MAFPQGLRESLARLKLNMEKTSDKEALVARTIAWIEPILAAETSMKVSEPSSSTPRASWKVDTQIFELTFALDWKQFSIACQLNSSANMFAGPGSATRMASSAAG